MTLFRKIATILKKEKFKKVEKKQPPKKRKKSSAYFKEIKKAKAKSREIILEAKDKALEIRSEANKEAREIQAKIGRKLGVLEEKEKNLEERKRELEKQLEEIEKIKKQQLEKLERAGQLTTNQAKDLILKATEKRLKREIARQIREEEEKADQEAEQKAREILVDAMYRGATDYVSEYTVSSVKLKDEDMKGRVIGREGRNIRTFEKLTGVDVDLDEEGVIRLSSFDSIRREVARVALEKLIADGRIQPARIEKTVREVKENIDRVIYKAGEELCHQVKVHNLPSKVIKVLGRFKYRFSYGQNMIVHTLEETKIGLYLAHEIGAKANVVRLGCLLHDIGKVISDEEGSHVELGVKFLKKFNIPQEVIDCVAQHHEDEPFSSIESVLVYIADAISGSRPGARYEDYEEYVERLEKLEETAKSFKGVKDSYAIQAGREVRVIVNPEKIDDDACLKLAHDLKEEVQKKLTYPGQVKITVIREVKATDVAK